jgi:methylenetetrahydrofolate reductase (NADPH)
VEKVFQDVKLPGAPAVAEALERARFEVIPLAGIEDAVVAHVPRELKVTVTVSPTRGIERTLETAERLAQHGYEVVPHFAARLVRGLSHLDELLARCDAAALREVFVVAGDAEEPKGPFDGAHALLTAIGGRSPRPDTVGITGYPESHPFISDEDTIAAMFAKAPHADYIVSQITFDADAISSWITRVRRRGTHLPIYVGLAGKVDRRKLLRISMRVGVGESARFLRGHGNWLTRLFAPRGYRPDEVLAKLAAVLGEPEANVAGLHLYTFNEVEQTERWRREAIERFAGA